MSIITTDESSRRIAVLDAPSNLGLKPPAPDMAPGCYKAPWALREAGLVERLGAVDAGTVVPPRYVGTWKLGDGVRNGASIATYTRELAKRVTAIQDAGEFPVLLGGDCSILLGPALALRRKGRYGLVHIDAHSDFREPENSPYVGSAAGEDLALVSGRGDEYLTDIDGLRPYFRDTDIIQLGVRDQEDLDDFADVGIRYLTSAEIIADGTTESVRAAREVVAREELAGFWIHVDVDVLDPSIVSAVDSPTPNGLMAAQLSDLLRGLLQMPGAAGLEIAILDPDLDPDGAQAKLVADVVATAFKEPTDQSREL